MDNGQILHSIEITHHVDEWNSLSQTKGFPTYAQTGASSTLINPMKLVTVIHAFYL
jgi:hypothetical protein